MNPINNIDENNIENICTHLFIMWADSENRNIYDPNKLADDFSDGRGYELKKFAEEDFISRVLTAKMKAFGLDKFIIVPYELMAIIGACMGDNPGFSQIMLHTILTRTVYPNHPTTPYVITISDFAQTYPDKFPDTSKEEYLNLYSRLWDDQKTESGENRVDTVDYWYPDNETMAIMGMNKDTENI